MNRLCILVGTTVGSTIGWIIPDYFGASFMWSFVISGVGAIVGVWAGWKLAQKLS